MIGTNNYVLQQDKLFVGTSQETAKLAPNKGLTPPVILSEVYPSFFCSKSEEKWGIVSVDTKKLFPDAFAPFPPTKNHWSKSLQERGICLYTIRIPPDAISKVTIYKPNNKFINQLINEQPNPSSVKPAIHKQLYKINLALLKWLSGEEIDVKIFFKNDYNELRIIGEEINNRSGLEVYYLKEEKRKYQKKR